MYSSIFDANRINEILSDTIKAIESGKYEIVEIVEHMRNEYKKVQEELKVVQEKALQVIDEVDYLEAEERKSRLKLATVSKNFNIYSEKDIKDAYEKANDFRITLTVKKEEEKRYIEKRKELEMRLKETFEVLKKAEKVNGQVSVAMEYLKGNIDDILQTVDGLSKKQFLGIKIIEAQEEERQRVARDIHDGPAQSMANVLVKAELCERLMEIDVDRTKEELKNLKEAVRFTLKDVRKIIYDLRPMSLDDLGLVPTLERYVYNYSRDANIQVNLNIVGNVNKVEKAIETTFFRIVQEALNNVRKHSKAKNVDISVESTPTRLNLLIADDGIGFNLDDNKEIDPMVGGFGIISMKERAELLNGKVQVKSSPGRGTKVYLSIPLNEEEVIWKIKT